LDASDVNLHSSHNQLQKERFAKWAQCRPESIDPLLSDLGVTTLKTHQLKVLNALSLGNDVILSSPTGSGKSLCYALPGAASSQLTLVISPLIALMRDQQRRMQAAGVPSAAIDSLQSLEEQRQIWRQIESGELRVLLVSPERLARPSFRERLLRQTIQLIAIDEAHCISQWGFHFRPEYRKLSEYLSDFGSVPRLALTATATPEVRKDIVQRLGLRSPESINLPPCRENLSLEVEQFNNVTAQQNAICHAALKMMGQGIIYAPTRRRCSELHSQLRDSGASVGIYHGGLQPHQRQSAQAAFISGKTSILVATNSFGMGIDKSDIRYVFHYGLPQNIENYVQEIGRAGRDGLLAKCILFYGPKDFFIQQKLLESSLPDPISSQKIFAHCRELLEQSRWMQRDTLFNSIWQRHSVDHRSLTAILGFLCRELIIVEMTPQGDDSSQERLLTLGNRLGDDPNFWQQYADKRLEILGKLRLTRDYARFTRDHSAALKAYFQAK
jgi:ATP-dependent DNA helicase RecQ